MNAADKASQLTRRKQRVRKRVFGTAERPRLNVFRSRSHIYAQIVDDLKGATLAAASSLDKSLRTSVKSTGSIDGAVVFDRGGRMYHGRVKALAEASREGGLKF
jgi:large subunit ribosomal protein L18